MWKWIEEEVERLVS